MGQGDASNGIDNIHQQAVPFELGDSQRYTQGACHNYAGAEESPASQGRLKDEFAIHKDHRYATVVMDLETGEVLWVGKDRTIEAFTRFFDEIEMELLDGVEAIAMDMNTSYSKVCQQRLPGAAIVYDRYHMESNYARDVMGVVRLDEARKYQERSRDALLDKWMQRHLKKQYTTIKKARWLLLSKGRSQFNADGTWESDDPTLEHILNRHRDIAVRYALKEERSALYSITDEHEAAMRWNAWFKAAEESGIPALVKFAGNKKDRLPGLVAHSRFHITTGKVEGTNNKINVLKRVAYGFRDDEYFFNLIRYSTIPMKSFLP